MFFDQFNEPSRRVNEQIKDKRTRKKVKLWDKVDDKIGCPRLLEKKEINVYLEIFSLIRDCYSKKDFISGNKKSQYYYNVFSLLPTTEHCVCSKASEIISNMTIAYDHSSLGLPMSIIYGDLVQSLRDKGRSIAEVTFLVTKSNYMRNNLFHYLVQTAFWQMWRNKVDDICITVHPRFASFYNKFFGFEVIGEEKIYPRVNKKAVALKLDIHKNIDKMKSVCDDLNFSKNINVFLSQSAKLFPENRDLDNYQIDVLKNGLSLQDFKRLSSFLECPLSLNESEISTLLSLYIETDWLCAHAA